MGDWAFQYDTLDRLTAAAPAMNAPTPYLNSIGCYGYDSFGNRTLAAFVQAGDCTGSNAPTASYDSGNHTTWVGQIVPIAYSAPTLSYDSSGDTVVDGLNGYAYDAEGRLCAVQTYANGPGTSVTGQYQYIYDASGRRVAMASFSGTFPAQNTTCAAPGAAPNFTLQKQWLVDGGGNQVTELDGSGNWVHSNVWAGAHLEATYDLDKINGVQTPELHFHLSDPLGTRRVQTNTLGVIENSFESLPFGDNLVPHPTGLPTSDDATEHHFTGKEHDPESGNDYFGARYYESNMGRFLSPDWSAKAEPVPYVKLADPQSLNLYAYVGNNPLTRVDADGHVPMSWGGFEGCTERNDCGNEADWKARISQMLALTNAEAHALLAQQQSLSQGLGEAQQPDLSIFNTKPPTVVFGPNPGSQAGCGGSGVPCTLSQSSYAPAIIGGSSYKYTIHDVNGNVVPQVTSVTEYFSNTTGAPPFPGTWTNDGSSLSYSNVAGGQFVDTLYAAPGSSYTASQSFSAQVGGVNYVISTSSNMSCAIFCTSTPINAYNPNP